MANLRKHKPFWLTLALSLASLTLAACNGTPAIPTEAPAAAPQEANPPAVETQVAPTQGMEATPAATVPQDNGAASDQPIEVQIILTEFGIQASQITFQAGVRYRFTITNQGMMPHEWMIIPNLGLNESGANGNGQMSAEGAGSGGEAGHNEGNETGMGSNNNDAGMGSGMGGGNNAGMGGNNGAGMGNGNDASMGSDNDSSGMGGNNDAGMGNGNVDMEAIDALALLVVEDDELPAGATVVVEYTFSEPDSTLEFACYLPGHYEAGMYLPISITP